MRSSTKLCFAFAFFSKFIYSSSNSKPDLMNQLLKSLLAVALLVLSYSSAKAQYELQLGLSASYNYQTSGIGIGTRVGIPISYRFIATPMVNYYPSFNQVHEVYLGGQIEYKVLPGRFFRPYLAVAGFYDLWLNSEDFENDYSSSSNIIPTASIGVRIGNKCFVPFVEQSYNPVWQEGITTVGVFWRYGCKSTNYKCDTYN